MTDQDQTTPEQDRKSDAAALQPLSHREFKFVESFTYPDSPTVGNASRSAMRAGYAEGTAYTDAYAWVLPDKRNPKPHVYAAILARRESIERAAQVTVEDIVRRMNAMSKGSLRNVTNDTDSGATYVDLSGLTEEEWYAINEIEITEYSEGRGEEARDVIKTKVKLADRKGATEILGKAMGVFSEKRVLSNDPDNPMPGTNVDLDLSRLTEDEIMELRRLQMKAMGK